MVKIRLKRVGKKKSPFYHVVVADSRRARDGKVIEKIGTYNPLTTPSTLNLDLEKVTEWMQKGAQPTETAKKLIEIAKGNKVYVPRPKKEEKVVEEVKDMTEEAETEEVAEEVVETTEPETEE